MKDTYKEMVASICKPGEELITTSDRDPRILALLGVLEGLLELAHEVFTYACRNGLQTPDDCHRVHASLGLVTEVGELGDAIKKAFVYNEPLNIENLREEMGDALFYITALSTIGEKAWEFTAQQMSCVALLEEMAEICESSFKEIADQNRNKLAGAGGRYENGYSDEAAKARRDKEDDANS